MNILTESVDGVIGVDTHRDTLPAAAVTAIGATLGNTQANANANADGYRRHSCVERSSADSGRMGR